MIRILVADDHPLFRDGLKSRLKEESDMKVVGEASNADDVISQLKSCRVDLAILDISMPGKDGLTLLEEIKQHYPRLPVLILTMHPEDRFAILAIKLGASAYITKETAHRELIKAIRAAAKGRAYIGPKLADELVDEIRDGRSRLPHEVLSGRELQVFRLLAEGKKTKEIAAEVNLSIPTVYTYRDRILKKMHLKSDADLIHYALRNKLIE